MQGLLWRWLTSVQAGDSLVDEVEGVRLELLDAVQVGEDEDLGGVLHRQICAQSILTHHLQPVQSILPTTGEQETVGKLNHFNGTAAGSYCCAV